MDSAQNIDAQLSALASYLGARREAILRAWRKAIDRDPEMTTGASLPRAQLDDHIPALLDTFERRLRLADGQGDCRRSKKRTKGTLPRTACNAGSKAMICAK